MTYLETASRTLIEAHQLARLRQGLVHILPTNPFYQQKLAGTEHLSLKRMADLALLRIMRRRADWPGGCRARLPFAMATALIEARTTKSPGERARAHREGLAR